MVFEYAVAERVNLAVEQVLPPRPVGGDFRAADAAEKRGVSEMFHCKFLKEFSLPKFIICIISRKRSAKASP